jgi:3-carboxy-cis,cis-muconate cycloisomerase
MKDMTADGFSPATVFSDENLWQSWLDVEAALARSQARLGIIPQSAADDITANASVKIIGANAISASIAQTMAPVLSLTRCLADKCGDSGNYVHWGATTQNVAQTGRLLLMRRAEAQTLGALGRALNTLGDWAEEFCDAPMVARTNRTHALPITFGFKVAGWIAELDRTVTRVCDSQERVYQLSFGGAVGAYHSFGDHGPALAQDLARELGLGVLAVPNRTANDLFVDHVVQLSMLGMSIERIALEFYQMMESEVSEMREQLSDGVVGSSTMPHKYNPKYVVNVIAKCAALRAKAAPAMEAGRPSHEGDSAANQLLTIVLDETVPLAWTVTQRFAHLLEILEPDTQRMQHNLSLHGEKLATENLMMGLAKHTGRGAAHDLIHHAIQEAQSTGASVTDAMLAIPQVAQIGQREARALLNSHNYAGSSIAIAKSAGTRAKALAAALKDLQ